MSQLALAPDEIVDSFRAEFDDLIVDSSTAHGQATVVVDRSTWVRAFEFVKRDPLDCDFLTFVSAIDWVELGGEAGEKEAERQAEADEADDYDPLKAFRLPEMPSYQVIARVYSSLHLHGVTLKANLSKNDAVIDTLVGIYAGADWHEREMIEMFGIDVAGHPNKEHLYLTDEFEGHPLRKDFKLGAREIKPWPGAVDVEDMPDDTPVTDDEGNVVELVGSAGEDGAS